MNDAELARRGAVTRSDQLYWHLMSLDVRAMSPDALKEIIALAATAHVYGAEAAQDTQERYDRRDDEVSPHRFTVILSSEETGGKSSDDFLFNVLRPHCGGLEPVRFGRLVYVPFEEEHVSFQDALMSVLKQLRRSLPALEVVRVEPASSGPDTLLYKET